MNWINRRLAIRKFKLYFVSFNNNSNKKLRQEILVFSKNNSIKKEYFYFPAIFLQNISSELAAPNALFTKESTNDLSIIIDSWIHAVNNEFEIENFILFTKRLFKFIEYYSGSKNSHFFNKENIENFTTLFLASLFFDKLKNSDKKYMDKSRSWIIRNSHFDFLTFLRKDKSHNFNFFIIATNKTMSNLWK